MSFGCLPLPRKEEMDFFAILYIVSLISAMSSVISGQSFDVLDYGAVGNGMADDTIAFEKAWKQACSSTGIPTMIIPKGKMFLVQPINFQGGNCEFSQINIMLSGIVIAPTDPQVWKGKDIRSWLRFEYVKGVSISGGGILDGRGKHWWDISCRYHPEPGCGITAPTTLGIAESQNVYLGEITSKRSGGVHIVIFGSQNVTVKSVIIKNPGTSPNTDGIHISHSNGVKITSSYIATGDDCISIVDRSYNVNISYVECGPGHGVSIGSLGGGGKVVDVQNISVTYVNFHGTTNGGRIKTRPGGAGQVSNVVFSNLNFTAVENPIIIDQNYGVPGSYLHNEESAVHIHNVRYSGLIGTSLTDVAMTLNCSATVPCTDISLESIKLTSAIPGKSTSAFCRNAYGTTTGIVQPRSCLRQHYW